MDLFSTPLSRATRQQRHQHTTTRSSAWLKLPCRKRQSDSIARGLRCGPRVKNESDRVLAHHWCLLHLCVDFCIFASIDTSPRVVGWPWIGNSQRSKVIPRIPTTSLCILYHSAGALHGHPISCRLNNLAPAPARLYQCCKPKDAYTLRRRT
jgi:hypothetical protein